MLPDPDMIHHLDTGNGTYRHHAVQTLRESSPGFPLTLGLHTLPVTEKAER